MGNSWAQGPVATTLSATTGSVSTEECTACSDGDDSRMSSKGGGGPVYAYMHSECPVNRRELGRASWAYLHTLAAFYPDKPDEAHAKRMHEFMLSYARFYPCGYCADTTSEEMVRNPPRTETRQEFAQWMCEIHNEVNDRLGKPQFDCSKVEERWRKAPPGSGC
eukprot:m.60646 g.60646  ORF g.60646 m.60646 type:complete len:164 (+) comp7966_c0_seq1:71-562(+)